MKRTHMCGNLNVNNSGEIVVLNGWVQKRRNLGGLLFITLRDRTGIVQLNVDPNQLTDKSSEVDSIRSEYVISVKGLVQKRPDGQVNEHMKTGDIEIIVNDLSVLNNAETPPFYIKDDVNAEESLRLKYRYLDLRRPELQKSLMMRHKIAKSIRDYLDNNQFMEIETPILTKSTPEGARDYLVPSRVNKGTFYALPQSPQIFKQLLMVGGYDRYFQIARCFRDEDLRADRQPEFTQVDIEMSFVDEQDVRAMAEGMVKRVFKDVLNIDLPEQSFPIMSYETAMNKYGSDKPDTRFDLEITDIESVFNNSEFKVFSTTLKNGGVIKSITVPQTKFSRKQYDNYTKYVKKYGAMGLIWVAYNEDGIKSSISKFLTDTEIADLAKQANAKVGDIVFIIAADYNTVSKSLGALRLKLAEDLELIDQAKWEFLWVVDFPLFEYDDEAKRYVASHHPFTMPKDEDVDLLVSSPGEARAKAYDMVLNGVEIGGGSIRIFNQDVQKKMFSALGFSEQDAEEKFGFFIEALKYGTPPHGGIAFGLDRLVMEMLHLTNIRDVIAFPKTTSASSLMSGAPGFVDSKQLEELYIKKLEK
ncbi:aspartate--tRNA ligase [Clostridium sp. 'deep sea']|uniref:aspartate--tRNA ligase n=1 Tax=Clostridium sp. 'deep sea' TaxID=2779445 RepID=UPI001FABBDE1